LPEELEGIDVGCLGIGLDFKKDELIEECNVIGIDIIRPFLLSVRDAILNPGISNAPA
jgi:hypothetical protein